MQDLREELKSRPILYTFLTLISVVTIFFMHNSVATIQHVRNEKSDVVDYVDKRHDNVMRRLDRIENKLDSLNRYLRERK